jgi:DNA-directed RNA polymerase subunit RPC12/RpoP
MALIECSECGGEVSDRASSCPNCGIAILDMVHKKTAQSGPTTSKSEGTGVVIKIIMFIVFLLGTAFIRACAKSIGESLP